MKTQSSIKLKLIEQKMIKFLEYSGIIFEF